MVLSDLSLIFFLMGEMFSNLSISQCILNQAICLHNWQGSDLSEHDASVKLVLSSFLSKDGSYYYPSWWNRDKINTDIRTETMIDYLKMYLSAHSHPRSKKL